MLNKFAQTSPTRQLPLYYKHNVHDCLDYVSYEQTYDNQNFVLSYMHPEAPYRGLLLAFQLGNGKTYCAAGLAHLYNRYGYGVLYLSHNVGTILNFKREYEGFITDNRLSDDKKCITYMGLTKFAKNPVDVSYQLVIIDEAHNLRENAGRYHLVKKKLQSAAKILVITATPMIDSTAEIESLRNIIEPDAPIAYGEMRAQLTQVQYVGTDYGFGVLFPSVMKGKQLQRYREEESRSYQDIYTGLRQTSLADGNYDPDIPLDEQSAKIATLLKALVPGELTIVFSFYIERGVKFLVDVLNHHGWHQYNPQGKSLAGHCYAVIDGRTTKEQALEIIDQFNSILNISGDIINLLIGSSVINESITLKNVQHVHILCPFWNYGQIEQAIGRAVRIGSHTEMIDDIKVKIYQHACTNSIDMDMYRTAWTKKQSILEHTTLLRRASIVRPCNLSAAPIPTPDNRMVLAIDDWVWDFRACFDTNINQISWCRVYPDRAVGYHRTTGIVKIGQFPVTVTIRTPALLKSKEVLAWRSCVDERIRISDFRGNVSRKFCKRGKLITNMKRDELAQIAQHLNCDATIPAILSCLRELDQYIDPQICYNAV